METGHQWTIVRTGIFTILIPGSITVLIPHWILGANPRPDFHLGSLRSAGVIPIALGAAAYLWCAWSFATAGRGTPFVLDPPRAFVARGLYRYTRNPMYVAVASILAGEGILFQSLRLFAYALIAWLACHAFVVLYEEPSLRRRFGAQYDDYCQRIPRWIPKAWRSES